MKEKKIPHFRVTPLRNDDRKCTSEKGTNALFVLREGME